MSCYVRPQRSDSPAASGRGCSSCHSPETVGLRGSIGIFLTPHCIFPDHFPFNIKYHPTSPGQRLAHGSWHWPCHTVCLCSGRECGGVREYHLGVSVYGNHKNVWSCGHIKSSGYQENPLPVWPLLLVSVLFSPPPIASATPLPWRLWAAKKMQCKTRVMKSPLQKDQRPMSSWSRISNAYMHPRYNAPVCLNFSIMWEFTDDSL